MFGFFGLVTSGGFARDVAAAAETASPSLKGMTVQRRSFRDAAMHRYRQPDSKSRQGLWVKQPNGTGYVGGALAPDERQAYRYADNLILIVLCTSSRSIDCRHLIICAARYARISSSLNPADIRNSAPCSP